MKKKILMVIILSLALGAGGYLLMEKGKDAVSVAAQKKGNILTAEQVNVSFQQVGGNVVSVYAQEEQRVKKGDILIALDPTDLDLQLAKSESDIAAMDIKIRQEEAAVSVVEEIVRQELAVEASRELLKNTKTGYDRVKELYDNGAAPKMNLDNTESQLVLAENKLNQDQETLSKTKKDLANRVIGLDLLRTQRDALRIQLNTLTVQKERLTLKAPTDGKIVRLLPKTGENISPGVPVVLIENDRLYSDFYVPETEITRFNVGKQIPVHVIALNTNINGEVRFITAAPQFASIRKTRERGQADLNLFLVRVYVKNSGPLLPGMTVEVRLDEIAT